MKNRTVRKKTAIALFLVWGIAAAPVFAAVGTEGKPAGNSAPQVTPDLPDGQNTEKLLYTLNETLQENRRIRQSMRDLQSAFEKVTLEKSDIAEQIKKVEQLAIQRNSEIGRKNDDLNAQLESTKKEMEKLQAAGSASVGQKQEMEKKLGEISAENARMQELLKNAILTPERDRIVEQMRLNDEAVQKTVLQISSMDGENIALKQRLIQSYFDLGNLFYDLGRYEDAVSQYLHVLEWDPYHAWAHHNLAVIYDFHLSQMPLAREHYQKYLKLKLPGEEAEEARMRLWDLTQLTKVTPDQPLKQDFDKYQKMPQA